MLDNTLNVIRYDNNGSEVLEFGIPFPYWDKNEIKVYLTKTDGTLLELGPSYYGISEPDETGVLTKAGEWPEWTRLTIIREVPHTQEVDLKNGMKIDADTLEDALDSLTAQIQQIKETQSRAIYSAIDESGGTFTLPNKETRIGVGRKGTLLGFSPDGNSMTTRDISQLDEDIANTRQYSEDAADAKEASERILEQSRSLVEDIPSTIDDYVTETTKPEISAYVEAQKPRLDNYVENTLKPNVGLYAESKVNEAIVGTVIPAANEYLTREILPYTQRAETAMNDAERAKTEAESAKSSAEAASASAEESKDSASRSAISSMNNASSSEMWATGATGGTPSLENNSKKYSEISRFYSDQAKAAVDEVSEIMHKNRAYSQVIGNGGTSYTITHNMGTDALVVQLWSDSGNPVPFYSVSRVDNDNIMVVFEKPIPADSVQVVIQSNERAIEDSLLARSLNIDNGILSVSNSKGETWTIPVTAVYG